MITLLPLKVIISDKNYCQIVSDIFQGYANENFEAILIWKIIKNDFEYWTKEN